MDLDVPGGKRLVEYPGIPLILIDGVLEPAPSWWLLSLAKQRRPADTIDAYAKGIELWFGALHQNHIAWHNASVSAAQGFVDTLLRRGNAESTVATRIATVLAFYKWAATHGFLPSAPFTRRDLNIPRARTKSVDSHSRKEFESIVAKLPRADSGARRRDELICECGRFLGLRRKEITGLKVADFVTLDPTQPVNIIWTDPAYSKGGKSRSVLVPRLLVVKVRNYVDVFRTEIIRRHEMEKSGWVAPPNLFLTERGTPVAANYITEMWRCAANAAGIMSRFHSNRASYATHVADAAMELGKLPIPIVKELLGHIQESTSERYIKHTKLRKQVLVAAHIINDDYETATASA